VDSDNFTFLVINLNDDYDHCGYWSEVKQVQTGYSLGVVPEVMNSSFQDKFCKSLYTSMARALHTEIENAQSFDCTYIKLRSLYDNAANVTLHKRVHVCHSKQHIR
jgi:hypothetical protein